MVQGFYQSLYLTAENGQTSYFFDMTNMRKVTPDPAQNHIVKKAASINLQTSMTNEEIVSRFQQKFPECLIKYSEEWVETNASTRVLRRGIMIDWS